jgi:hypothetical protein
MYQSELQLKPKAVETKKKKKKKRKRKFHHGGKYERTRLKK